MVPISIESTAKPESLWRKGKIVYGGTKSANVEQPEAGRIMGNADQAVPGKRTRSPGLVCRTGAELSHVLQVAAKAVSQVR